MVKPWYLHGTPGNIAVLLWYIFKNMVVPFNVRFDVLAKVTNKNDHKHHDITMFFFLCVHYANTTLFFEFF